MKILFYFSIFLFGLAIGSFLNCLIYRLKTGQGFLKGRSFCPNCKHTLSWQDLIPLLSFLILKGKCHYCQKPISLQYPLIELTTGILFILTIYNLQFTIYNLENFFTLGYLLFIVSCLLVIFVYDLKHYIIPDRVLFPAIIIALIFNFQFLISKQFLFFSYLILSAIGAAAFFLAIVLISRGKWMGVGDIKLAFLMGLFLGWPNILVALFSAFLIGAIIGIILMILGKKTLKSEVPFGPFLVTGTFLALFWGQEIVNFYVKRFYFGAF